MAISSAEVVDTASERSDASPIPKMAVPHLILMGYGVGDSLQLTVEAQRILARYGTAYSLGLPPNLAAFLKSLRVNAVDLTHKVAPGRDYAEGYLEVAHDLIQRTATERPVIFLAPGNPLIFNAIGRYLAMEGRRLGLGLQSVAAVSPLDVIISGIGLDVSTFGLQVFDATRLVARRQELNPMVPAILMHLGSFNSDSVPVTGHSVELGPLVAHLSSCYPGTHPATVIHLGAQGMRAASLPLGRLAASTGEIQPDAHLFLDAVRAAPPAQGTPA